MDLDKLTMAETAEIGEISEANMLRTFMESASPETAEQYGFVSWQVGRVTALMLNALPWATMFNRVVGLGLYEPADEATLDALIARFDEAQTPLTISLSPASQPAQLSDWLMERGFQFDKNFVKMIRGNEPVPEVRTDLRIEEVDGETADASGTIIQTTFEMPGWCAGWFADWFRHPAVSGYLAYQDDKPIGTGGLSITGEWGGLAAGSTLPGHRRLGAQSAIMAHRLQHGIANGCRWFTTETEEDTAEKPNPSYRNMRRLGFKPAYLQPNYIYHPNS